MFGGSWSSLPLTATVKAICQKFCSLLRRLRLSRVINNTLIDLEYEHLTQEFVKVFVKRSFLLCMVESGTTRDQTVILYFR